MSDPRPSVVILAGPNGAGKSTVAPALLHGVLAVDEFVNADVIASGLSAFDPESAAIAAGRVMLERLHGLAQQRVSFAFETTLASRSSAPWLRDLRASGYAVHLSSSGCLHRIWPVPRPVAEGLASHPPTVYDRDVWAAAQEQARR